MQPDEIKSYGCVAKWLTETELKLREDIQIEAEFATVEVDVALEVCNALESLAATRELSEQRRVLMEKHQWCERSNGSFICRSCKAIYLPDFDESNYIDESTPGRLPIVKLGKGKHHKPDCAWDAALKGVKGE